MRIVALAISLTASAALTGCGAGVECQAPLTTIDCSNAVQQAEAALEEHPNWVPEAGRPARLTLVWDACQDAGCDDHLDGFAFVRVVDARDLSIGRVTVCVEDQLCRDQEVSFGFP